MCHGKPQAKYWMHNGLMQAASEVGKVGGRNTRRGRWSARPQATISRRKQAGKIGKSKGASAFRDLLERHQPETIRFFLLSTHYRSPIHFSEERLQEDGAELGQVSIASSSASSGSAGESFSICTPAAKRAAGEFDAKGDALLKEVAALRQRFLEAMDDDFNTGGATAALFELLRTLNKFVDTEKLEAGKPDAAKVASLERGATVLRELAGVLGLFRKPVEQKGGGADDALVGQPDGTVDRAARRSPQEQRFCHRRSDSQRLTEMGITLEDRPGGTEWRRG